MGINAILTISFEEDVPFDKKAKFYSMFKKDGWIKVPEIKNSWKAVFKDSSTIGAAINVTKYDVDRASKKSKILKYKAVINLDEEILESFDNNSVF